LLLLLQQLQLLLLLVVVSELLLGRHCALCGGTVPRPDGLEQARQEDLLVTLALRFKRVDRVAGRPVLRSHAQRKLAPNDPYRLYERQANADLAACDRYGARGCESC
jgi:hypothetical protein